MTTGLVNQHQQSSYANPQNGQAADATVVLGNDNTTVTTYNTHDADPTIHLQSSTLALRPTAATATAGAKWMSFDTGPTTVRLSYSDGSSWYDLNAVTGSWNVGATMVPTAFAGLFASPHNILGITSVNTGSTVGSAAAIALGYGSASGKFLGAAAAGTITAPSAVGNGSILATHGSIGYDGTSWGFGSYIDLVATQTWSVASHGANVAIYTTPNGSLTAEQALLIKTTTTHLTRLVPGSTSLVLANNADNADNLMIADSGAATFRANVTIAGAFAGATTATFSGAVDMAGTLTVTTRGTFGGSAADGAAPLQVSLANSANARPFIELVNTGVTGWRIGVFGTSLYMSNTSETDTGTVLISSLGALTLGAGLTAGAGSFIQAGKTAAASVSTASTHKISFLDATGTTYSLLAIAGP